MSNPPKVKRGRGRPKGSFKLKTPEQIALLDREAAIKAEKQIAWHNARMERVNEIIELRRQNLTYELISKRYKITRERVRQILKKFAPGLACFMGAKDPVLVERRRERRRLKRYSNGASRYNGFKTLAEAVEYFKDN